MPFSTRGDSIKSTCSPVKFRIYAIYTVQTPLEINLKALNFHQRKKSNWSTQLFIAVSVCYLVKAHCQTQVLSSCPKLWDCSWEFNSFSLGKQMLLSSKHCTLPLTSDLGGSDDLEHSGDLSMSSLTTIFGAGSRVHLSGFPISSLPGSQLPIMHLTSSRYFPCVRKTKSQLCLKPSSEAIWNKTKAPVD